MIRGLQRGEWSQRIRMSSAPSPCTWGRCFRHGGHPLAQPISAACHQLYPGARYCTVLLLLVLATDSVQVGQATAKTSHSKQAKSFLTGFLPLLYSLREHYNPQPILGFWVVPCVSSQLAHGLQPSQPSQQPS